MISSFPVCRITCHVPHVLSPKVRAALERVDLAAGFIKTSRSVQIRERILSFLRGSATALEETLSDTYYLFLSPDRESAVMEQVIAEASLEMADRGSIYSERLEQMTHEGEAAVPPDDAQAPPQTEETRPDRSGGASRRFPIVNDIANIRFIVPRGLGSAVARIALEMGTSVPSITYGIGTGRRDHLGLLRIAIPADKELVTVTTPGQDAELLMHRIVEGARLNQPGAGFVYVQTLDRGLVNIRLWTGPQRDAASMNQIVAAVDTLWGDTGWRRRFAGEDRRTLGEGRGFVRDLSELTLIGTEERMRPLLYAAMEAGAGGATTSRVTQFVSGEQQRAGLPGALELTTMVVPQALAQSITGAIESTERTEQDPHALSLFLRSVPYAYSYRRRRS